MFTCLRAVIALCLFVKVGDVAVLHGEICRAHDGVIDGILDGTLVRERREVGNKEAVGVDVALGFDDSYPRLGKVGEILLLRSLVIDFLCLVDHLAGHVLLLQVENVVPKVIITLTVGFGEW